MMLGLCSKVFLCPFVLGLEKNEHYSVIRTVAWDATHDTYPHYLNLDGTIDMLDGSTIAGTKIERPRKKHGNIPL